MGLFADSLRISQRTTYTSNVDGYEGGQPNQLTPAPDADTVAAMIQDYLSTVDITPVIQSYTTDITDQISAIQTALRLVQTDTVRTTRDANGNLVTSTTSSGRGVTSLIGTANQIILNSSIGDVTIAIPNNPLLPGIVTAMGFAPNGGGSTQPSRYMGGTVSAAPTTGAWLQGDYVVGITNGTVWVCTASGSPGTWVGVGNSSGITGFGTAVVTEQAYGQASALGSGTTAAYANHTHGTPATPVTSNIAGQGISVNANTGAVTISNAGVTGITTSSGLSTNTNAVGLVSITNTGVTSNVAGTGIGVSGATGAVTITNNGVTSVVAGTAISVSGATGAVTVNNTGVTNLSLGATTANLTLTAATGAIQVSMSPTPSFTTIGVSGLSTLSGNAVVKGTLDIQTSGSSSKFFFNTAASTATFPTEALSGDAITQSSLPYNRLTGAAQASIQAFPSGDSQFSMLRWVTSTGSFTDANGQQRDGLTINNAATRVADTTAYAGQSIANTGMTTNVLAVSGPGYTGLQPGQYQAVYYVKVSSTASTSAALTLQVTGTAISNNPTVAVKPSELATTYIGVVVPFTITSTTNTVNTTITSNQLPGAVTWQFSHVRIQQFDGITTASTSQFFFANAAITNAQIQNITASQIIAGSITSDDIFISTGGHVYMGTKGGARTELSNVGLTSYLSTDLVNPTVQITNTGTFQLRSANTGTRVNLQSSVGIELYNGATRTFFADVSTGNLTLTGNITATGGAFTGNVQVSSPGHIIVGNSTTTGQRLQLDSTGLRGYSSASTNDSTNNTLTIATDGSVSFASGTFTVTSAGVLTATSGVIGGWALNTTNIKSSNNRIVLDNVNPYIAAFDSGLTKYVAMFGGGSGSAAMFGIYNGSQNTFYADYNGNVYMTGTLTSSVWMSGPNVANGSTNGNGLRLDTSGLLGYGPGSLITNGSFEAVDPNDSTMPAGWVRGGWTNSLGSLGGGTVNLDTSAAARLVGLRGVTLNNTTSSQTANFSQYYRAIPVTAGESITMNVWLKGLTSFSNGIYLRMLDQNGTEFYATSGGENVAATTSWVRNIANFTVPAGVTSIRPFILMHGPSIGFASTLYVDLVNVVRNSTNAYITSFLDATAGTFYAADATISGTIYATEGNIGGFDIASSTINYGGTGSSSITLSPSSGIALGGSAGAGGSGKFRVTATGDVYTTGGSVNLGGTLTVSGNTTLNATLSLGTGSISSTNFTVSSAGVINATSATLSSVTIQNTSTMNGSVNVGATLTVSGVIQSSANVGSSGNGYRLSTSGLEFYNAATRNFYVDMSGNLTATGATVTGVIRTGTSGQRILLDDLAGFGKTVTMYTGATGTGAEISPGFVTHFNAYGNSSVSQEWLAIRTGTVDKGAGVESNYAQILMKSQSQDGVSQLSSIELASSNVLLSANTITTSGTMNMTGTNIQLVGGTGSGTFQGTLVAVGTIGTLSGINLNSTNLYVASGGDSNHRLYYASTNDGPVLQGYAGVIVGYVNQPTSSSGSMPGGVRIGAIGSGANGRLVHSGSSGNFHIDSTHGSHYIAWYNGANLHLGNGTASGNGTYFGVATINSSSKAIKKNIRKMDHANHGIEKLRDLQPVRYRYKDEHAVGMPDQDAFGFIAEEIQLVYPEVVRDMERPDGLPPILGINYSALVPVVVTAVHELHDMVVAMKAELEQVKAKVGK